MNRSLKGICFTVAGGCCWGMSGVMGKYLFDAKDLTATWLVTVRLLGAGICLLLLMYQRKGNSIFSCMEKKRFSGQSADLRDDWNGYVSDDVLPCHSGVKSGNCDSSSVFCTNLNYGVLCISGKKISKERRSACTGNCDRRNLFACNTWKYKNLVITNAALFWGLLSAFAFAVYNVQPKKLLDEFGTLETTGWGMFVGGVW